MNDITEKEKKNLFHSIRVLLGYPERGVEIADETLDTLLTIAIEEYGAYLNENLILNQWSTLQNMHLDKNDFIYALTTKTLDFEQSFTYAYSKQAGVGSNAPWELKRDYFVVSADTQIYTIPANREINSVLWQSTCVSGNFTGNLNDSSNFANTGFGWNYFNNPMAAVLPASYMYLSTQNNIMMNNILRSQNTYKITAGPNGTKHVWLFPVPGSSDEVPSKFGKHTTFHNSYVWYWYYDVNASKRDLCLENNTDVILLPTDVPLNNIPYQKLNSPAKTRIRRLLAAEAMIHLGLNRGKYSGQLVGRNAKDITMDYGIFLERGTEDKAKIFEELALYLENLTYDKIMERRASISNNLNEILKNTVNPTQFFWM